MKITFFAGLRHRLFNMLPYLAVSLLIWTVCVLSSFGGERETFFSVFTEAVGGVEHSGQFDLFGFFRYFGTFFAGLFLGMAGSVLDSETMPYFVLPRSKSFFKWWIKTVSSALLWCVLYCLIGIAVCAAAAEKVGALSAFELMRMAAYPLALGASMCVLCLLRFLLGQKPAAAIVIAVVGTTGLICGKLKGFSFAMLGAYGMAKQLTDAKTAAAVLFADTAVMILVFFCSGAVKRRALKGGHYFD